MSAPRWVPLARGFHPAALLPLMQAWQRAAGMDPELCKEVLGSVQVEHPLAASDWSADGPGLWSTALPGGAFAFGAPGFLRIAAGERTLQLGPGGRALEPGSFKLEGGRIVLRLAPSDEPPGAMTLSQHMESGRKASDGVWQVRLGGEFDAGIAVWSGIPTELVRDVPAASRLAFDLRWSSRGASGPIDLRVRIDGEVVHESRHDSAALAAHEEVLVVVLPPRARTDAKITFEVAGPPGQLLLLHPILGPAEFGSYGKRPWKDSRADIVLFLADTFRADNLAAYGGAPELAPNLNRFAASARRFTNARSNAAWTLPSISSLLSGLAPGQHTANETGSALPPEIRTVAERLAEAGYRTGAITDACFFTPIFGLDQGFETFVQNSSDSWNLGRTVARALEFLERDDGRPVFLVVHTYRAHLPYRVGPEEDRGPWDELVRQGYGLLRGKRDADWLRRLHESKDRYRALYLEGVRALDVGFGAFVAGLEQSGLLASGALLFTSDHGEALGENDDIFHAGDLWETKLRVPLVVHAPGLAAEATPTTVTLLDLAPTLAELAHVEPDPLWSGSSLFGVSGERPACAFRLQKTAQIALVDGGHKIFVERAEGLALGRCDKAFDLGVDPGEEHDVGRSGAWPAGLARQRAELVQELLRPVTGPSDVLLNKEMRRELRGLGYDEGER